MSEENQACEVPLVEQLRSIPEDYRTVRAIQWSEDGRETGHQFIPVGFMMHRAAAEIERLRAAAPEERPRLSVMPIVKTLKDQRDECAEVLRQIMTKLREENPEPDDLMYPFSFDSSWEQLATAADAILAKCPSYEQQLRNVAEGIGMTYEELIEAVKLLPAMNSGERNG